MLYGFRSDKEIDAFAIIYIEKNKRQGMRTSLSGLFKHIRRIHDLDCFGDFVILSHLTKIDSKFKKTLRYGFKMSKELTTCSEREKKQIIRYLEEL
jgi:hypothetical protein